MNPNQKNLLIVCAAIIALMLLFPPFHYVNARGVATHAAGHHWLFNAPLRANVAAGTLILQWLGVLLIGGIAFFVLKEKDE